MNRKMEQHSTKTITKGYQKSKRHFQCPDRNAVRAAGEKAVLLKQWKKKEVMQKNSPFCQRSEQFGKKG